MRVRLLVGCVVGVVVLAAGACVPAPGVVLPSIVGDPVVGSTLSASRGEWFFEPSQFEFRWESCDGSGSCSQVGSDSAEYVVEASDMGRTVRVVVVASNAAGSASRVSASVGPVEGGLAPSRVEDLADGDVDAGMAGESLSVQLTAPGLGEGAVWSLVSGDLPDGVGLSPSGVLSGTPDVDGEFEARVRAEGGAAGVAGLRTAALGAEVGSSACEEVPADAAAVECDVIVWVYPAIVYEDDAVVLTGVEASKVVSWDPASGALTAGPGGLGRVEVGSVVQFPVGTPEFPFGGLVRVDGVVERADGGIEVETSRAEVGELIRQGTVRDNLTDAVDADGSPVAAPSPECGRGLLVPFDVGPVTAAGVEFKFSSQLCVSYQRDTTVEGDSASTEATTTLRLLPGSTLTMSGPGADFNGIVPGTDVVKLDDLYLAAVPNLPFKPVIDVGLFAQLNVQSSFEVGYELLGSVKQREFCDGTECETKIVGFDLEATPIPEDLDLNSFLDELVEPIEFKLAAGPALRVALEIPKEFAASNGLPTGTFVDAQVRGLVALRGETNPELLPADQYPFNWAVYGEVSGAFKYFNLDFGQIFGFPFKVSLLEAEILWQWPLWRSDDISFTNFNESRDVPSVVSIGYEFPLVVANVVPVDGQIISTSGRFQHPSSLGGIPVTIALYTAVETGDEIEAGPLVPGGLEGTTTETSDSNGVVEFDDLRSADNVAPGRYVLRVTATDPDGDPFLFGDGILEGVSDAFDMKQVEWFPTAVPHPDRVQLGWPEYQLDQTDDGDLAGYRIYRLDRDDDEPSLPADGTMPYAVVPADVIDEPYCSASSTPPADAYGGCVTWTDPDSDAINQRYTYVVAPCFSRSLVPGFLTCASNFGAGGSTLGFYEGQPIDIPRAPAAPLAEVVDLGLFSTFRLRVPDFAPDLTLRVFGCNPTPDCDSRTANLSLVGFDFVEAANLNNRIPGVVQRNFEWGRVGPPSGLEITGLLCAQVTCPSLDRVELRQVFGPGPIETSDYCLPSGASFFCPRWPNRWNLVTLDPVQRESAALLLLFGGEYRVSVLNSNGQESPLSLPVDTGPP